MIVKVVEGTYVEVENNFAQVRDFVWEEEFHDERFGGRAIMVVVRMGTLGIGNFGNFPGVF